MTTPWRKTVEPYASIWRAILKRAQSGLIHGMQAHHIMGEARRGHAHFPADTADMLRDMVITGDLRPVKKDWAGAGTSIRSFRALHCMREDTPAMSEAEDDDGMTIDEWLTRQAAEAYLWTFEPPPRAAKKDEI
jgi:hypothetical protein